MRNIGILMLSATFIFASCKSQQQVSQLDEPEEEDPQEEVQEEVSTEDGEMLEGPAAPTKPETPASKPTKQQQLNRFLGNIATAPSTNSANQEISEALSMFSSPDATVLVIFYQSNGKASYDEPTTISKYLNYLKDTNNKAASVEEMVLDENGKIKELILKK